MTTITRVFGIDVGHRLLKHESKCRHVHGHRYTVEVVLAAPSLDEVGRILDFGEIKSRIGTWFDEQWDHGFLAQEGDPIILWLRENEMKHRVLPFAPTAENLAQYLGEVLPHELAGTPCSLVGVKLWETPNCCAEWRAG